MKNFKFLLMFSICFLTFLSCEKEMTIEDNLTTIQLQSDDPVIFSGDLNEGRISSEQESYLISTINENSVKNEKGEYLIHYNGQTLNKSNYNGDCPDCERCKDYDCAQEAHVMSICCPD